MKSPRITLSIALLLSLPAKVYAADVSLVTYNRAVLEQITSKSVSLNHVYSADNEYAWRRVVSESGEVKYTPERRHPLIAGQTLSQRAYYADALHVLSQENLEKKDRVLAELPKPYVYQGAPHDSNTEYTWQRIVDADGKVAYLPMACGNAAPSIAYHADSLRGLGQVTLEKKDRVLASLPKALTPNCRWERVEIDGKIGYSPIEMSNLAQEESAQYFDDIARTESKGKAVFAQLKEEGEFQSGAASSSSTGFISLIASFLSSKQRPQALTQGNWKGTTYFVDGVEHAPVAWQSNVEQEAYAAGLQERLDQTPALIEEKETIFGRKSEIGDSHYGLVRNNDSTYAPSMTTLVEMARESGVDDRFRSAPGGFPQAELNLFNKATAARERARQGDTPKDQERLIKCLQLRENLILGTPWTKNCQFMDPGLNFLTALSAKTLEQRTKVHTQLLATMTTLSNELNSAHAQAYRALKEHADDALIYRLGALTQAAKVEGTTEGATDALWTQGVLEQFATYKSAPDESRVSLQHLPLEGFAYGANSLYKSWYTSYGEPMDATALRTTNKAIAHAETFLAKAKAEHNGLLIDRYTRELIELRKQQETQFTEVNKHIAEPTRALLLTHESLLDACTRIRLLTPVVKNLQATLTADAAGHTEDLATLAARLALLTADDREQGMSTRDALTKLFSTSRERAGLTCKNPHDPDYYFVSNVIAPEVNAAKVAATPASSSSSAASSSASSSC